MACDVPDRDVLSGVGRSERVAHEICLRSASETANATRGERRYRCVAVRSRCSPWSVAGAVLAGAFVANAAGFAVATSSPTVPGSLDATLAAAADRLRTERRERPTADGTANHAGAAEHYVEACRITQRAMEERGAELLGWHDVDHVLRVAETGRSGFRNLPPQELAEWRAAFAPALAQLRRGAQCRDGFVAAGDVPAWWRSNLASFVPAEIAMRCAEGDACEAVHLWLDLATFRLDLDETPSIGEWTQDRVANLPATAATLLEQGLEHLEPRMLVPPDLVNTVAPSTQGLRHAARIDWHWRCVLEARDHGFDPAAVHLAAWDEVLRHVDVLHPAEPALAARTAQWDLFLEVTADARTRSSIVAWWIDHAHRREQGRLSELAALRSLRLGLATRLRLPLPCLVDPTTDARFVVDEEGSAIVVRREPVIASRRWTRCP